MPSTSSVSPSAEEKLTCTSSISNSTKKFKPGHEMGTQFQIWCLKLSSFPFISADSKSSRASGVAEMLSIVPFISAETQSRRASGVAEMLSIYSCVQKPQSKGKLHCALTLGGRCTGRGIHIYHLPVSPERH